MRFDGARMMLHCDGACMMPGVMPAQQSLTVAGKATWAAAGTNRSTSWSSSCLAAAAMEVQWRTLPACCTHSNTPPASAANCSQTQSDTRITPGVSPAGGWHDGVHEAPQCCDVPGAVHGPSLCGDRVLCTRQSERCAQAGAPDACSGLPAGLGSQVREALHQTWTLSLLAYLYGLSWPPSWASSWGCGVSCLPADIRLPISIAHSSLSSAVSALHLLLVPCISACCWWHKPGSAVLRRHHVITCLSLCEGGVEQACPVTCCPSPKHLLCAMQAEHGARCGQGHDVPPLQRATCHSQGLEVAQPAGGQALACQGKGCPSSLALLMTPCAGLKLHSVLLALECWCSG